MVRNIKATFLSKKRGASRHVCCCSWLCCLGTLSLILNGTLLLGTIWANYKFLSADVQRQEHAMMNLLDKEKSALWSVGQELTRQLRAPSTYHLIFSTGCSDKQHWQSYVFFHSVLTSGQKGDVTRIASGCSDSQAQKLKQLHSDQIEPMGRRTYNKEDDTYSDLSTEESRFHLHLTPDFGHDDFHYLNKPYGVCHWMENVLGYSPDIRDTKYDDTIIILYDPDMIQLRPFVDNDFTSEKEIWRPRTTFPYITEVDHGYPMAAEYGYSDLWFRKTNLTKVIPPNEMPSPMQSMPPKVIEENFAAGPPYMATARDFYAIADKWRQFSKPVHEQNPASILTEMYAYSLAAAHLNLPHQLARTFMVSEMNEDGLALAHSFKGNSPSHMCRKVPLEYRPHVLHYCHRYALGKYVFGKHRMPTTFVGYPDSCSSPLLAEPPDDAPTMFNFYIDPDTHVKHDILPTDHGVHSAQENINQITFLLCQVLIALNKAATYYKQQHCKNPNLAKALIFHDQLEINEAEMAALSGAQRT